MSIETETSLFEIEQPISHFCNAYNVSKDVVYRWIRKGMPALKNKSTWCVSEEVFTDWLIKERFESLDSPWKVFTFPLVPEEKCEYTHVSLFSGCGGIDLGFRQAGFRTIFANDIDEDACKTYEKNLGKITLGDIREIEIPDLKNVDVLSAGFPCQPFSNAGSRKGVNDKRGDLYVSALNAVEKLSPKVVMFENVRGLLSSRHNGRLLIEVICESLDKLGYNTVFSLVDASNHNVPQRRLRVIIIGVNRNENLGRFAFPNVVERNDLALKFIVSNVPESLPNQTELMQLNPQAIQIAQMIPEGGSWRDIPYPDMPPRFQKIADNIERYHWPKFYRRFHRNEIAGTITAAFKPENAGVWHPIERRIFSVREIARIQTFPDWFIFEGSSIKSKYQQIGNAVPARLAYEVALQIKKVLVGIDLQTNAQIANYSDFKNTGRPIRVSDHNIIY